MRKVGERKDWDSKALCDGEWALEFWSYLSREFGEFVDFDLKPGFCEAEAVLLPPRPRMFKCVHPGLFCKHNTSCVTQKTKQRFVSLGECVPSSIYTHSTFFRNRLNIRRFPRTDWLLPPKHFSIHATPPISNLHCARLYFWIRFWGMFVFFSA